MMRRGMGLGSFLLGAGIGIIGGVFVSKWLERSQLFNQDQGLFGMGNQKQNEDNLQINLDKEEIAEYAKQFLGDDQKSGEQIPKPPIH